jgi:hypothetical protein
VDARRLVEVGSSEGGEVVPGVEWQKASWTEPGYILHVSKGHEWVWGTLLLAGCKCDNTYSQYFIHLGEPTESTATLHPRATFCKYCLQWLREAMWNSGKSYFGISSVLLGSLILLSDSWFYLSRTGIIKIFT